MPGFQMDHLLALLFLAERPLALLRPQNFATAELVTSAKAFSAQLRM
jgi:hypothetical protein